MKYTAEEVRARFEAWAEENGYDILRNDGFTAAAWHGYQTAYAKRIKADEDVVPAYWAAIGEKEPDGSGGEIVLAYPADDGNDGEAARTECNQYINDAMLNERVRLRLVPLFTHPPAQVEPTEAVISKAVEVFLDAAPEWNDYLVKDGMRAALLAVWPNPPSQAAQSEDWRIGFFEGLARAAREKGYADIAEAIHAAQEGEE